MTSSFLKAGLVLVLTMMATACASSEGVPSRAPSSDLTATTTSLTLEELTPGVCNPVMFEERNENHTGAGYINPPNSSAARVTWSVRSPVGGKHVVAIRYANGSAVARPGQLSVNGNDGAPLDLPLPRTETWTQWSLAEVSVDLKPGSNTLVLRATSEGGLPNIDSLTITGANPSPGDCGKAAPASTETSDLSHLGAAPVGWVTQNTGVTGGGDVAPVTATTMNDLLAHASGAEPKVIHVSGKLTGILMVGSNKTIVGLPGAEIKSAAGALRLSGSRNVIIKNLTLVGAHGSHQPNTVLHDVENVWLDHNSFVDGGPDLVLLSGTSSYVTLSWNVFRHSLFAHEHAGVNIGSSDSATESIGRMKVTMHHNYFAELVNERMPRVRFGQVHTFNNLADGGDDVLTRSYYAVRPGVDANIRSERNVYANFRGPSWYWTSEKLGAETATVFNFARGNENSILESIEDVCTPDCVVGPIAIKEHEGVTGVAGFYSRGKAFVPPYVYTAEQTAGLAARIRTGAGAR